MSHPLEARRVLGYPEKDVYECLDGHWENTGCTIWSTGPNCIYKLYSPADSLLQTANTEAELLYWLQENRT